MIARATTIAAVGALAWLGCTGPLLVGAVAWLVVLAFVASGWGYLLVRALRIQDPDFGLRAAWGLAGYLAIGGIPLALGVLSRPVILGLVGIGFAGFAWRELVAPNATPDHVRTGLRALRANPIVGGLAIALALLAIYKLVGAAAQLDRDPWDDDIAYTPFIKRLLDVGDLVEPFSFRRLGAYGGQTVLQALVGARGELANIHLLDKGLFQALLYLLVLGAARRTLWVWLLTLVLLLAPETAINTASYWSGAAMFLALYRTVVAERWLVAGLVGAATCTLRMNYLPVVALFLAIALLYRRDRRAWLTTLAGSAALVPWMIAAFVSSRTFLFPFMQGTWNHALSMRQGMPTWIDELRELAWCAMDSSPIIVWPALAAALCFVRDRRPARPLVALVIASALGFALLVHGLVGTEPSHVWRYAFGYTTALLAAVAIELDDELLPDLGRWVVLACLALQLLTGRGLVAHQLAAIADDVRAAQHGAPEQRAEAKRYAALQAAMPVGARIAIMLDDPALLDYSRNDFVNLDTPGFASAGTWPAFAGPEALRTALLDQGIHQLAFVRPTNSRYFYRREFWVGRLFTDTELFEMMSAYAIDAIDNMVALTETHPVHYEHGGLVLVDLDGARVPMPDLADEAGRRDRWIQQLARTQGMPELWSLTNRSNVRFDDGIAAVSFVDPAAERQHWAETRVLPPEHPVRGVPSRWVQRRAHLRIRGDGRLAIRGIANLGALSTHPRVVASLDGEPIAEAVAGDDGRFALEAVVRAGDEWHDVYLEFSSIGEPERDLRDLRMARLEAVEWDAAH